MLRVESRWSLPSPRGKKVKIGVFQAISRRGDGGDVPAVNAFRGPAAGCSAVVRSHAELALLARPARRAEIYTDLMDHHPFAPLSYLARPSFSFCAARALPALPRRLLRTALHETKGFSP